MKDPKTELLSLFNPDPVADDKAVYQLIEYMQSVSEARREWILTVLLAAFNLDGSEP